MDGVATPPWESPYEHRVSMLFVALVLCALTVAKTLGHVPYLGQVLLTGAAFLQLYLPVTRADARGVPLSSLGLSMHAWRRDAVLALKTLLIVLPPYAIAYHLFFTHARAVIQPWSAHIAMYVPQATWAPHAPAGVHGWFLACAWFGERVLTHTLGVALPEEVFYRGYVQPSLAWRWPPRLTLWNTPMGFAVVLASAFFAFGHFLGEWNPMRLGPFFPGLLFGWLRNRSGTVMAAIGVHAGCNLFVELFSRLYS